MKLSRRIMLWIAISAIVLPGVVAIVLMPSSVEGVYDPFSTFGCTGDQFMEMRNGRIVTYLMCSKEAYLMELYEKDPTGSIMIKLSPGISGDVNKPIIRAEPHLLGTRFYYLGEGNSEWFWKRFLTKKMRDQMAGSRITDVVSESGGAKITTYDYQFNVISTSFRPKRATSPPLTSSP